MSTVSARHPRSATVPYERERSLNMNMNMQDEHEHEHIQRGNALADGGRTRAQALWRHLEASPLLLHVRTTAPRARSCSCSLRLVNSKPAPEPARSAFDCERCSDAELVPVGQVPVGQVPTPEMLAFGPTL